MKLTTKTKVGWQWIFVNELFLSVPIHPLLIMCSTILYVTIHHLVYLRYHVPIHRIGVLYSCLLIHGADTWKNDGKRFVAAVWWKTFARLIKSRWCSFYLIITDGIDFKSHQCLSKTARFSRHLFTPNPSRINLTCPNTTPIAPPHLHCPLPCRQLANPLTALALRHEPVPAAVSVRCTVSRCSPPFQHHPPHRRGLTGPTAAFRCRPAACRCTSQVVLTCMVKEYGAWDLVDAPPQDVLMLQQGCCPRRCAAFVSSCCMEAKFNLFGSRICFLWK